MIASLRALDPHMGEFYAVRMITLVAVAAMLLTQLSGAIPNASVGGPMTIMLILFITMLAVGIHEAWSNNRGLLGWIVNIVVVLIGGFVTVAVAGMGMETVIPYLKLNGSLASSQHPLLYLSLAVMTLFTVFGSWIVLQLVSKLR